VRQGFRLRSYTDFGGQDGVAKRDRMKSTGIVEGWKDGKGEKGGDQWERWKNGKGEPFGIFF
jgi:hypothetical protein